MGNITPKNNLIKSTYEVEVLEPPATSPSDPNSYQVIRLKNGLVALLISKSGPSTKPSEEKLAASSDIPHANFTTNDIAFASLSINVGSYSDPDDKQGLAQLLERVLLNGASQDFPKCNEFKTYIQKIGATIQTETNCEDTTYCVSVNELFFEKVLKRLSSYFQTPIIKKEIIYENLINLEKEFETIFKSDSVRLQQLILGLGKPGYPSVSYSRGHTKLLRNKYTDQQIYESLIEFHARHYSAHRMVLSICSNRSVESLECLVIDYFKNIPNNLLPPTHFAKFVNPYNSSKFFQLLYVKPIQNMYIINVTWSIIPQILLYRQKPCQYIAWMLKYEGHGSLLASLKSRAWVTSIEAGIDESYTGTSTTFSLFKITLYVTPEGMDNSTLILDKLFSYLEFLRNEGPREYLYNEIKLIKERIQDNDFVISTNVDIMNVSKSMLYTNSCDILTALKLFYTYNEELIQSCIDCLVPSLCNIVIMDPRKNNSIYKEEDRYFGTEYSTPKDPNAWFKNWKHREEPIEFRYPPPNEYLSEEDEILPMVETTVKYPECIINNSKCELWYKRGDVTKRHGAYLYYSFNTSMCTMSAKCSVLLDIYLAVLQFVLKEHMYQATIMGLQYTIERSISGFELKVHGKGLKIMSVVNEISKKMKNCTECITMEAFTWLKNSVQTDLCNSLSDPSIIIEELQKTILLQNYYNAVDKHAIIADITISELANFEKDLFCSLTILNIVQGYISEANAFKTLLKILNNLDIIFEQCVTKKATRIIQIPCQEQCICAKPPEDINKSIVRNYYQLGPTNIPEYCMLEIVLKLMTQSLKDILKVKNHTPRYDLNCSMIVLFGVLGFNLTVSCEASKYTTSYVNDRIASFLRSFKRSIRWTGEKEFNSVVEDLIKQKLEPIKDLETEVSKHFTDICNDEYNFARAEKEITFLQQIDAVEVANWFHKVLQKNVCKKISFQVCGQQLATSASSKMFGKTSTSSVFGEPSFTSIDYMLMDEENFKSVKTKTSVITDVAKYKNGLNSYPLEH